MSCAVGDLVELKSGPRWLPDSSAPLRLGIITKVVAANYSEDELTPFDATTLRYEIMFAAWCSWDLYVRVDSKSHSDVDALFRSILMYTMAGLPTAQA